MHKLIITSLFGFILIFHSCEPANKITTYDELIDAVNILEKDSLYNEAKSLLVKHQDLSENHSFSYAKEIIYINDKTGNHNANLEIFREAQSKGQFFMIHPRMSKYKPYLPLPGFEDIASRDLELRDSVNRISKPDYRVLLPAGLQQNKRYPVIFIFHGGGSNLERVQKHWKSDILDKQFIRVFIRSALHYDYNTFGWRNSDDQGLEGLKNISGEIIRKYPADTSRMFAAGVSAGGTQAVYSVFRQIVPLKGYLGVCTGIPNKLEEADYIKKHISAFMITGTEDHYKAYQDSLSNLYEKNSIRSAYYIIESMGHQYPDNFSEWIDRGLNYLLYD